MAYEVTSEATPDADVELLIAADQWVLDAISGPYAQAGHAFDGQSTGGLQDRTFGAMIAPGAKAARAWLVNWATGVGAGLPHVEIESTSSGGITGVPGPDVITIKRVAYGSDAYADVGGPIQMPVIFSSGDDPETAPGATMDRRIELPTSLSPQFEEIRVTNCAGFGLVMVVPDDDLE